MNRREFMKSLREQLSDMLDVEREEALEYYEDYLNDAGISDDDIVPDSLGTPESIVENIKKSMQNPEVDFMQDEKHAENPPSSKVRKKMSNLSNTEWILIIVLLVVTSPVWGSVVIGAGGSVIGLVAGIAGIFIGMAGLGIGLMAGGFACVVAGLTSLIGFPGEGLFIFGLGAVILAIGLLCTTGMINATVAFIKWIVKLVKSLIGKVTEKN